MTFDFDLLGDEVRPHVATKGRRRHKVTDENRRIVKMLAGKHVSQLEIAAVLRVTHPTLRMYYFKELGSRSTAWKRREPLGGS